VWQKKKTDFVLKKKTNNDPSLAVVKQRLQVHGATTRTVLSTFRNVYHTEGLGAFYVSYPTTLTMTGALLSLLLLSFFPRAMC
jgi:hypothetical protein